MSYSQSLIARSQHQMVATQAAALLSREGSKGCQGILAPSPVALEPVFEPIEQISDLFGERAGNCIQLETSAPVDALVRYQIWIPPTPEQFDWSRNELFHKLLLRVRRRLMLEIVGNCRGCQIILTCHMDESALVAEVFKGTFAGHELCRLQAHPLSGLNPSAWGNLAFHDYYPDPPYSALLTRPESLHFSPYEILISTLSNLEADRLGFFQAIFQPADPGHDWHSNIEILLNLDYAMQSISNSGAMFRLPQQVPSATLQAMSGDSQRKAHDDKPIFALAMRVGVVGGADPEIALKSLSAFASVFLYGGRPLRFLTHHDYAMSLSSAALRYLFLLGLTYRPGFIVNSWELSGVVHLPPAELLAQRRFSLSYAETLPPRLPELFSGTPIGTCRVAGEETTICISDVIKRRGCHLIGRPFMGKSTLIKKMCLHDIQTNASVIVIDPHGDLVRDLLMHIPEEAVRRTVVMEFPNDWVPMWNPLTDHPGLDPARLVDNIIYSIRSNVDGWGDRMETLLRNALLGLMALPERSLGDVYNLLRGGSRRSEELKGQILDVVDDPNLYNFFDYDFRKYREPELTPGRNKLHKLVSLGSVGLMLQQTESRINLAEIMNHPEGGILLMDLSNLGNDLKGILGGFTLSLIFLSALARAGLPEAERHSCFVYCDEAQRFLTEALREFNVESRKFAVHMILAHQQLSQFPRKIVDALTNVGASIIFGVDAEDAGHLKKDLRGLVSVEDITSLERGQAIAHIGSEIVRIETLKPPPIPEINYSQQIIDRSHRLYYRTAEEVRANLGFGARGGGGSAAPVGADSSSDPARPLTDFVFDEFS